MLKMLKHTWTSLDKLGKIQQASNILLFTPRKFPKKKKNNNNKVIFRP